VSHKNAKERIREEAAEEARQDQEQEALIEQHLRKWKRGTVWIGIALVSSVVAVVPFLYGYPLHYYWDALGKRILVLSMCLLSAFMYTAGITFTSWLYLRDMKRIHKEFAPPGFKS
jgi:hypothetical protein